MRITFPNYLHIPSVTAIQVSSSFIVKTSSDSFLLDSVGTCPSTFCDVRGQGKQFGVSRKPIDVRTPNAEDLDRGFTHSVAFKDFNYLQSFSDRDIEIARVDLFSLLALEEFVLIPSFALKSDNIRILDAPIPSRSTMEAVRGLVSGTPTVEGNRSVVSIARTFLA